MCHKLEDTCTQKRRLEDGSEGGQGPTRTVESWSNKMSYWNMNKNGGEKCIQTNGIRMKEVG